MIKKKDSPKTHFEQVPLDIVKEIAVPEASKAPAGQGKVRREPSSKKTEPYSTIRLMNL